MQGSLLGDVMSVWRHRHQLTSLALCIKTYHVTVVHITLHKLNNCNFHYFIIIYSYSILIYIIIQKLKKKLLIEIVWFLILLSDSDMCNNNCIFNKNPTRCNSMQILIYCRVILHVSGVTAPHHQEY